MTKKNTVSAVCKRRRVRFTKAKTIVSLVMLLTLIISGIIACLFNFLGFGKVTFNYKSGFYEHDLTLKMGVDGLLMLQPITIRYNTNGNDLSNDSHIYEKEIVLTMPETGYELYTISVAACLSNGKCTEPQTMTYILGENLNDDITLKVVNVNSAWDNLYDYDTGIMVGGATYDYNEATVMADDEIIFGNYNNRGEKWMRDAYITMFDTDGELIYDEDAMLGISGGSSSSYDVKSLKISIPTNENRTNKVEFRLRSGGQVQFSGNVRSSVASRLTTVSNFDGGNTTERVVVFLNGDYYGIFDMQNNYSKEKLAHIFNLTKKSRVEKHKGSEDGVYELFKISPNVWNNLSEPRQREELEKIIDMDDYLKYFAIQILLNNTDWPMNNFEGWRYNGGKSDNKYEDGRIRFLLYDTDLTFYTEGNVEYFKGSIGDIFEFLMENKYNGRKSTFNKVMESEYYRNKFVGILEELINGPFAKENVLKTIDDEANRIEHQVKLFSSEEEYEEWMEWIVLLKKTAAERNEQLKVGVKKYLGVDLNF